jgi:hypothetical protein
MAKAHFVLVHGAYHQPQHWDTLAKLLQSSGHATSTPRLPSVSSTPPPECFKADAAAVKQAVVNAVAQGATTVVPVLHSYGGIPGFEGLATLTAEEKAKIPRVVCISAFVVPKDNSLVSVQEGKDRTYVEIDVHNPSSTLPLEFHEADINHQGPIARVPDPIPFFYSDVEPDVAAHAASLLLPHAIEAFFSITQHDGCADFPVTYVVCNNDKALTVEYQHKAIDICRSRENRKGGSEAVEVVTMESGHSPFLSMPEETVQILLNAAGESL